MVKTEYEFEKKWWNAKAHKEEIDMFDEKINRELRWKEINKNLTSDIKTILDVGGATGVFSIPLAQKGFKIVHFDISDEMISIAKNKAIETKLTNITFEQGISADLSRFDNDSFDLVLNMDGAVSFCGIDAEKAINETIRVAKKKVIMTVSNKANMIISALRSGLHLSDERFIPAIYEMFDKGFWHTHQYDENTEMVKGCTNDYLGPIKAFTPEEIKLIFENNGMKIERLTSIGSLSNHCGKEFVDKLFEKPKLYLEYIDLCDRFDKEICPDSIGSNQRAGIMIVASK
jgi:ubiquinone/menaquinone biosynthesis C-methylase UbiE